MCTTFAVGRVFGAVAVLMAGTLADGLIGSGMDRFAAAGLPEKGWLAFSAVNSWVFPTTMPWVLNGTLIALIVASIWQDDMLAGFFAVGSHVLHGRYEDRGPYESLCRHMDAGLVSG